MLMANSPARPARPRRTSLRLPISRVTGCRSGWVRRLRGIAAAQATDPKGHENRGVALRAGALAPAIRRADQLSVHCWLAYTRPTRIAALCAGAAT
jgi:hypothetical protein